jgi:hypothetical protein
LSTAINELRFHLHQQAQPQGSLKAFMRRGSKFPVVTCDNSKMMPFRDALTMACRRAIATQGGDPDVPWIPDYAAVSVEITYTLLRPKSVTPKRRPYPTAKPDLDKLARCAIDSMTGFAYADDAQVVEMLHRKRYGAQPLVEVVVRRYEVEV